MHQLSFLVFTVIFRIMPQNMAYSAIVLHLRQIIADIMLDIDCLTD